MDHADIASNTIDACTAEAEARARGKSGPEHDARYDGLHCVECGEEIPDARRALGKVRDVECQALFETPRR